MEFGYGKNSHDIFMAIRPENSAEKSQLDAIEIGLKNMKANYRREHLPDLSSSEIQICLKSLDAPKAKTISTTREI